MPEAIFTVIDRYFDPGYSHQLFDYLGGPNLAPDWSWSIYPGNELGTRVELNDSPESIREVSRARGLAYQALADNQFSYCFLRLNHFGSCSCIACECIRSFYSVDFVRQMSERFDVPFSGATGISCSWYKPGCFLSPHFDTAKGKLAFVYQLAYQWLPEFGGCLCFSGQDLPLPNRINIPGFNKLVLFDVSKRSRTHSVSRVEEGVHSRRLAFTGWLY
jgi:hypothetical protein